MALETRVTDLAVQLNNLPNNMRTFSKCLRYICLANAVDPLPATASDFIEIIEETRRDATRYVDIVLPLTTEMIRSMEEFFGYYVNLDMETWSKNLPGILAKVNSFQERCTNLLKMYKGMVVVLKERQNKAMILTSRFENINHGLVKHVKAKKDEAASTRKWADRFVFVPFVNFIATPLLDRSADSDMRQAMMMNRKVDANNAAISMMKTDIIPALSAFINSLTAVASFFQIMKEDLTTFNSQDQLGIKTNGSYHYETMRRNAHGIKERCKLFYATIPEVQTDVQCIPRIPLLPA